MRARGPLRSLALFACVYGAALLVWPWIGEAYARALVATAGAFSELCGLGDWVRLRPNDKGAPGLDVVIFLGNRASGAAYRAPLRSLALAYQPTALVLAWVVASAGSWRTLLRGTALGLAGVHAYVFLRLALLVLRGFDRRNREGLVYREDFEPILDWGAGASRFWELLVQALHLSPMCYVLPILIGVLAGGAPGLRGRDEQDEGAPPS